MKEAAERIKRYVLVTTRTDEEGHVRPLEVQLHGKTYVVDEVLKVQRRNARRVGGDGICYTVRMGRAVTEIYYDHPRWFVEEKVCEEGC
ncbi:hypothetical protein [Xiamenia xianingshaonis]|uniref:Uncharacterized protein n=1 Tax=Xiamenia xianingshaonis TaxID=2682776 RepID=A0A9E6SV51_9ACTN|nr:hypothetical protein [Xiamenia xianingshaonis]NHM14433.1 hypothetical protein [Xiamenia xianingshaonis]QTU84907.1 hypothetical protein J7S26_03075 [Xiamenia xianingshaonis]